MMVRLGAPARHEIPPNAHGERHVYHPVRMDVTDLATVDTKLDAPETMWFSFDAGPTTHDGVEMRDRR
jgi:hypothetical protein